LVEAGGVPLKEHEMEMDLGDDDDRHTIAETVITEGGVRLVEAEKEGDEEPEREVVKMEPEQEHGTAVEPRILKEEEAPVQQQEAEEHRGLSKARSFNGGASLGRMDSETIPKSLREPWTAQATPIPQLRHPILI
jgi:hypothetical protein